MQRVADSYPGASNPDSSAYPGGSFKNETTPGSSNDGTPLDQGWANDTKGALLAVLKAANITPDGSVETADASQFLEALGKLPAPKPTGFTGGNRTYVRDTNIGNLGFTLSLEAPDTWLRVGPSTDPTAEIKTAALDDIPASATAVILQINVACVDQSTTSKARDAAVYLANVFSTSPASGNQRLVAGGQPPEITAGPERVISCNQVIFPIVPGAAQFAIRYSHKPAAWPDRLNVSVFVTGYVD